MGREEEEEEEEGEDRLQADGGERGLSGSARRFEGDHKRRRRAVSWAPRGRRDHSQGKEGLITRTKYWLGISQISPEGRRWSTSRSQTGGGGGGRRKRRKRRRGTVGGVWKGGGAGRPSTSTSPGS